MTDNNLDVEYIDDDKLPSLSFNYYKTIETNRLVCKGLTFYKIFSNILITFYIAIGTFLCHNIISSQLRNNVTVIDYLVSKIIPTIIIPAFIFFSTFILN